MARQLPTWRIDRILFATVLNAGGQHARAKELCSTLAVEGELATALHSAQRAARARGRRARRLRAACARLDALLAELSPADNPLALGNAQRDRAHVALRQADRASSDRHFAAMEQAFRRSHNPLPDPAM